jgi:phosphate transport system permease protein
MKKFLEKIVTGVITCSGFLSSFIILLIVIFLFSEGFGLFSQKTIEEGYSLLINKENPVNELDAKQIKEIFDEDVTNWKEVGGRDEAITLVRFDDLPKLFSPSQLGENYERAGVCIDSLVNADKGIIAFVPSSFVEKEFSGKQLRDHKISIKEVFTGKEWFPTATPAPQFGFVPLVLGTVWVTVFAILFALPFGLAVSIYMSEVASERMRKVLKPVIELLNGIPSVVYGFFGLIVIVPLLQDVFGLPVGESGLAGALVLAIMALPTIITVSQDAMMNCPRSQREASLALGATRWQTIYKVVMPYSVSGITSAVVLGIGRAFGETMAVLMVTGNAAVIPLSITDPLRTIPATIAAELGEAPAGGPHYQSLFLLGVVLFFITLIINSSVEYISSKNKQR